MTVVKIFFLSRCIIFGKSSEICINTFSLGRHFLRGDHLGLESSCIRVNMVTASQHAVISQKNEDLIYITAEA